MEDSNSSCSNYSSTSMAAEASSFSTNPKPFSQGQLNGLVRDLNLSKESSELLASRLGEHGVLDSGTKITFYRSRDDLLLRFFTMEDDFVFCNNIPGLFAEMGLSKYNSDKNIINEPLVSQDRIILPPLHIKLGLMKQFVKALDKHGDCFNYIVKKFPSLSMKKMKAGIFLGPQIRKLIQDQAFTSHITAVESVAWCSYVSVV